MECLLTLGGLPVPPEEPFRLGAQEHNVKSKFNPNTAIYVAFLYHSPV